MSNDIKLVLASVSPRRKELMELGGWQFKILPAGVDEDLLSSEKPQGYVLRIAESKARAVAKQVSPSCLIIGADTTVVGPQGEILAKPQDEKEALDMLQRLRGRLHQVYTGVVVIQANNSTIDHELCVTDVYMRSYTEAEMHQYIATGDPFDKAGGYAIQHQEFNPVERIKGCYANVVGLPVCTLAHLLEKQGVETPNHFPVDGYSIQPDQCPICKQLARSRM